MIAVRALSEPDLVAVWERGMAQHPIDRALTILGGCSDEPWEALARATIGTRDAALLAVYERSIGGRLDAFAECPMCAERLEYTLDTRELLAKADQSHEPELSVMSGEISLRLRLPNSLDLAAAAACPDAETAGELLAERCIVEARSVAGDVPVKVLSSGVIEAAGAWIAAADPLAETTLELTCLGCGHAWWVLLDIESFLWAKIASGAKRLLREVHVLARAYGWREADILSMTPARRGFYLEMVS
jgi:hypothetical protein